MITLIPEAVALLTTSLLVLALLFVALLLGVIVARFLEVAFWTLRADR